MLKQKVLQSYLARFAHSRQKAGVNGAQNAGSLTDLRMTNFNLGKQTLLSNEDIPKLISILTHLGTAPLVISRREKRFDKRSKYAAKRCTNRAKETFIRPQKDF